jgi:UDP:flavonoid glycosyltransferase YjiC (YdhE family)
MLGNPSYRDNAKRLAAVFARHRGPDRAAELLEGLTGPPALRVDSGPGPYLEERL